MTGQAHHARLAEHERKLRAEAKRAERQARRVARRAMAADLASDAELLVRRAEQAHAMAQDPTLRDVAETELQAVLALQDTVMTETAPVLERAEQELRDEVHEVVRAVQHDPLADWTKRHRRWHQPRLKSRLVQLFGRRRYEAWFPW